MLFLEFRIIIITEWSLQLLFAWDDYRQAGSCILPAITNLQVGLLSIDLSVYISVYFKEKIYNNKSSENNNNQAILPAADALKINSYM